MSSSFIMTLLKACIGQPLYITVEITIPQSYPTEIMYSEINLPFVELGLRVAPSIGLGMLCGVL